MEESFEKKEQAIVTLKEKLKEQQEKWTIGLKSNEEVKRNTHLLEDKLKYLTFHLDELNESETSLKLLIESLSVKVKEQDNLIKDAIIAGRNAFLNNERELTSLAKVMSEGYVSFGKESTLDKCRITNDDNERISNELQDLKSLITQKNLKSNDKDTSSDELNSFLRTINRLQYLKRIENEPVNNINVKYEDGVKRLELENKSLQKEILDIKSKLEVIPTVGKQ